MTSTQDNYFCRRKFLKQLEDNKLWISGVELDDKRWYYHFLLWNPNQMTLFVENIHHYCSSNALIQDIYGQTKNICRSKFNIVKVTFKTELIHKHKPVFIYNHLRLQTLKKWRVYIYIESDLYCSNSIFTNYKL